MAEIVFWGINLSQHLIRFYYILKDLIFLLFLFYGFKLLEARFVWWVVGWHLSGFSLWVVSGIFPAMFFSDLFTHFLDFWSQIGVVILVTPKQEMERKSECFCGVNFFRSNFKVEWENGVWTKIRFLSSDFLFTCGNFTLIFTVFSIFWIGFFSNWFS